MDLRFKILFVDERARDPSERIAYDVHYDDDGLVMVVVVVVMVVFVRAIAIIAMNKKKK